MTNGSSGAIVDALQDWIVDAPAGAQLPSTRSLVAEHGVSPVTVQKALRELARRGLVESRPGVGTFVRPRLSAKAVDHSWQTATLGPPPARIPVLPAAMRSVGNDAISLHAGFPDPELLPMRLVRAALTRAARSEAAVARPPVAGLPDLQAWFARELAEQTAPGVSSPVGGDVVVLPGSQSGLTSIFSALAARGGAVVMESPTYWGAITAAAQVGATVVPVPARAGGPDPDDVDRALRTSGARVFYAQPTYANPTGAQWDPSRGREILDVVRARGAFLVEDDWARDFGISSTPRAVAADDDSGHVIYLRSLSKSVSPAFRVAGMVARGPVRERILADQGATTMYVSGLLQAAALDVVSQPAFGTHLRRLREQLQARRDLLLGALGEHAPAVQIEQVPAGGLNLWARLPDGSDVGQVVLRCERSGLVIAAGSAWFPAEPTGAYVRLSYAGPDSSSYGRAAQILGGALDG